MKTMSSEWNVYRTRFLIKAKQLTQPLFFVDGLGREHSGKPGDYLVESSDGSRRIAPKAIFEDVYVVMDPGPQTTAKAQAAVSPSLPYPQPRRTLFFEGRRENHAVENRPSVPHLGT